MSTSASAAGTVATGVAHGVAAAVWVAAVIAVAGCSQAPKGGELEPHVTLGKRVHDGPVRAVAASFDGAWIAFLDGCNDVKSQVLPPGTASCDLRVVAAGGGAARKVAGAVTTLPYALAWHPSADLLAALAEYDYVQGTGRLVVARGGGDSEVVADGVAFHGFVPADDRVAAIVGGKLVEARPGSPPEWTPGTERISSFEFNPLGKRLPPGAVASLLRRPAQAGGVLLVVERDGKIQPVGKGTGDYAFAPGGAAYAFTARSGDGYELRVGSASTTRALAQRVHGFQFSRDGQAIAYVSGAKPGAQGDLHVARLGSEGPPVLMGRDVGEFRWAARAPRLAWLERYDPRVRAGRVGVGGPELAPRTFAADVSEVELAPDGAHVAWLQHTTRGGYSVDLAVTALDGPPDAVPRSVAQGVFGFGFSPDARWLYYRTRCTRNAEACDLERVPASGPRPLEKPELVAEGVKSFEFDPRDPARLLLGWQRMDLVALDIAVWKDGRRVAVDRAVLPGSAKFLGPDSRRVVYVVVQPKRAGVYVAEVPR